MLMGKNFDTGSQMPDAGCMAGCCGGLCGCGGGKTGQVLRMKMCSTLLPGFVHIRRLYILTHWISHYSGTIWLMFFHVFFRVCETKMGNEKHTIVKTVQIHSNPYFWMNYAHQRTVARHVAKKREVAEPAAVSHVAVATFKWVVAVVEAHDRASFDQ